MAQTDTPLPIAGLLTRAEAAELLKVSPRTLYRLSRAGTLPIVRVGRQVRIHPDDLARFIEKARSS